MTGAASQLTTERASVLVDRRMLSADPSLASPEDMGIPQCVASGDEAIAVLRAHHDRWQRTRAG